MGEMEAVAFLMAAVAIVTAAFRRMGWNPVLGLIASGIALGPNGFQVISSIGSVHQMAELGILFLLFIIGVELSADRIRAMAKFIFGLGTAHFLFSGAVLGGFAWALGESLTAAVVLGVALAMSSTAFVLQTLSDSGQLASGAGRKSFSVLLFQDIMVAPILAALPLVVSLLSKPVETQTAHATISLPVAIIAMMIIFVVARLLLQHLIGYIHDEEAAEAKKLGGRSSYFLSAVVAVALSMGVAAHHLGLSASLGAFLAGFALSGAEWRHDVRATVKPLESTFLGIFFMSLGTQVPLSATPLDMLQMALAALGILTIKAVAGFGAAVLNGIDIRQSSRVGLILAQSGEFAFIILGSVSTVLPEETVAFWSGAAILSLVSTPLLVTLATKLSQNTEPSACDQVQPTDELPETAPPKGEAATP
ncbi:cation:proton antiporter [Thalassospira xiamenensis]|uniref:Potassium/proton antiporter membrane subunit, CPA2 family n=1 Tax=Thalassospira xiamenensis TaxID=220697 RepID=A0A285TRR7_9PROT|nr:cation:proton antiporter [Thalassospira xiamenensis]SOC26177.1 potassium/proton antiporter membrane subunit, CPA2 family [Thalassospira xiamenensis]